MHDKVQGLEQDQEHSQAEIRRQPTPRLHSNCAIAHL